MSGSYPSPPNDEDIRERNAIFENIFEKYGHLRDEHDEGFDMDTLIALADAEDFDKLIDNDEYSEEENMETEAFEDNSLDPDDYKMQKELIQNMRASPQEQFKRLTYWFDADFIDKMKKSYAERARELEQSNLPFFNFRQDETFTEDVSQTTEGLSVSRKYTSSSALTTNSPQIPLIQNPRKDNQFLNYARSNPSFSMPNNHIRLPTELSNMLRGHSSFNVRIREYDLSVNSGILTPGLHLAHSFDNIIDSGFKTPFPPPNKSSIPSYLRQQSAPPLFHEKYGLNDVPKKFDNVSIASEMNGKIESKVPSSSSKQAKDIPRVPEKKSKQTKTVKANQKPKTCAAKEVSSKVLEKPNEKEQALAADNGNQKKATEALDAADLLTLDDVSTAGSSLTTDDDEFFFTGGTARYNERHLSHRVKKLHKRKNELRAIPSKHTKMENSPEVENKLKPKNLQEDDSDSSTSDEEIFGEKVNATKNDVPERVNVRTTAENRKKFEVAKQQQKSDERARIKKKVYENSDSDSSD